MPPVSLLLSTSPHTLPCLQLSQHLGYPVMRENVMKKKSLLKNWIVIIQVIILNQPLYVFKVNLSLSLALIVNKLLGGFKGGFLWGMWFFFFFSFFFLLFSCILRKLFCGLVGGKGLTSCKINMLKKCVHSSVPQSKRNQNARILKMKLVTALNGCGFGIRMCKQCLFGAIFLLDSLLHTHAHFLLKLPTSH